MRRNQRKKIRYCPTQKDIADALGYSQSTIAMALNPQYEHRLMEETVARIKEYAAKVGYHPQRFAQLMQGGRSQLIGVLVRFGMYTSAYEIVVRLANELNRAGYRLVLIDVSWFGDDPEAVKRYLLDQSVEGVIFYNLMPYEQSKRYAEILPATLPVVSLQSTVDDRPAFRQDLKHSYSDLTRIHLALGAKRMTLLSSFRDPGANTTPSFTIIQRALGFAEAIHKAGGVVVADEYVRTALKVPHCCPAEAAKGRSLVGTILYPVRPAHVNTAYENGYHQTRLLIEAGNLPDVLLCANDDTAVGVLAACTDHEIKVPETVRITGHDDTMAGRYSSVPLTTIRIPVEVLVKKAARRLIEAIENHGENVSGKLTQVPCEIILRRSSGTREELERLVETGISSKYSPIHLELERNREVRVISPQ